MIGRFNVYIGQTKECSPHQRNVTCISTGNSLYVAFENSVYIYMLEVYKSWISQFLRLFISSSTSGSFNTKCHSSKTCTVLSFQMICPLYGKCYRGGGSRIFKNISILFFRCYSSLQIVGLCLMWCVINPKLGEKVLEHFFRIFPGLETLLFFQVFS